MAAEKKDISWLVEQAEAKAKLAVTGANVRAAIRALVKAGDIEDPKTNGRYEFKGVSDPTVKAIIAKLKENATKSAERKTAPAAKKEGAKPASSKRRKKAAAPEPEVEEEDFEDDELDLDDE